MIQEDKVILVDESDHEIGEMGKMEAHFSGTLHRAISILIFNSQHEMLIQQRAFGKYHSPGLWSNTCCSHPRPGEATLNAANRRLMEEMGLGCELMKAFEFKYRADFDNGLIEHEFDHVYVGVTDQDPVINLEEANAFEWIPIQQLLMAITSNPDDYTPWFRIIMEKIEHNYPELMHL
jgi:isopentenyl-diphosphate Delta-isomerase